MSSDQMQEFVKQFYIDAPKAARIIKEGKLTREIFDELYKLLKIYEMRYGIEINKLAFGTSLDVYFKTPKGMDHLCDNISNVFNDHFIVYSSSYDFFTGTGSGHQISIWEKFNFNGTKKENHPQVEGQGM